MESSSCLPEFRRDREYGEYGWLSFGSLRNMNINLALLLFHRMWFRYYRQSMQTIFAHVFRKKCKHFYEDVIECLKGFVATLLDIYCLQCNHRGQVLCACDWYCLLVLIHQFISMCIYIYMYTHCTDSWISLRYSPISTDLFVITSVITQQQK